MKQNPADSPFLQTELKMAVHAMLESSLNRVIQLDPQYRDKLQPLHNRIFSLHLTDIDQTLNFCFTETDVMLRSEVDAADVQLSGTIVDLIKQSRQINGAVTGKFRIQGDIESAQQFQHFIQTLNLDWEEMLSHYMGDIVAHKVSRFTRDLFAWGQQAQDTMLHNVADYLQTESEINPDTHEMQDFIQKVNTVRDDSARLQARISRLKKLINE